MIKLLVIFWLLYTSVHITVILLSEERESEEAA